MIPINYTFKNINDKEKAEIENYMVLKEERFDNLMRRFTGAECRLDVKAEKFATKSAYFIDLSLYMPGEKIMAKEDDHTLREAIDLSIDKLVIQLRKLVNKK